MTSSKTGTDSDVVAVGGGVCNEHQGAFHLVTNAKGSVGVASRGGEMEIEVIGIARGDVDGDGDVIVGVRVATGANGLA